MSPNPAPESLYITQITALYHPAHYGHQTTNSRVSSLLAPRGGDERLFSQAKLHGNAESSGSCLFSTQLTVVANVRNVALLKLETHDTDDRSDTCDA